MVDALGRRHGMVFDREPSTDTRVVVLTRRADRHGAIYQALGK